ncbi:unnamed protein product [Phytophthora fragariaefolia]|uniref:Unnamed protein product n=1 Tax=Phytophthora fragariaefolia TaxID=1490495 RepID=A0A9W6YFY1_9STRA|nr:unnamed protein product [Phytophthora fragariaefolia]
MLSGLRSVKLLIQHDMEMVRILSSTKIGPAMPMANFENVIVPERESIIMQSAKASPPWYRVNDLTICGKRVTRLIVTLMPVCGVFVLLTSITSSGIFFGSDVTCADGCKLRMHPWFTRQCACSVMEINCFERGITGRATDMHSVFQSLDARVLNSLIVSHFPELVFTEDSRRFNRLMTLELYNSTVVEWPSTSSLSLPYFPVLTTIFFLRSHLMKGLPDGIATNLSPEIIDIEFIATELGGPLPDDLDEKWPSVVMLYVEHCGLQDFPLVLTRMGLTDVSLAGNNISVLPDSLSPSSMYIMLDRNPLDSLPDSFGSLEQLVCLTVQYTNISIFPQSLIAGSTDIKFRARGTPYCHNLPPDSPEAKFALCAKDELSNGVFPLVMRDRDRAIQLT